jgi:hypothetical protein
MIKKERRPSVTTKSPVKSNTVIIIRYRSALRKARAEAFNMLLEESQNGDGVALDEQLVRRLSPHGWDWRSINTAANDVIYQGRAILGHGHSIGSFCVVPNSADAKEGEA